MNPRGTDKTPAIRRLDSSAFHPEVAIMAAGMAIPTIIPLYLSAAANPESKPANVESIILPEIDALMAMKSAATIQKRSGESAVAK